MPEATPPSPPPRHDRLQFGLQRLALMWHAFRNSNGPRVRLREEAGMIRVGDGVRQIYVPHLGAVSRYRDGITPQIESVAEKYLGGTSYIPRPSDTIVDIGAGNGEFSLWCAKAGASVVAFEPDPLAFACLEKNVALLRDVRVFPFAIWKERAGLRLHGTRDTRGSSLIEDGKPGLRAADVEAWPLDQLQVMIGLPVIDFMKIDGEGVEPEILSGGLRTLRRTRVVSVDVGAGDKRPNLAARVAAVLDTLNFRQLPHARAETILALNTAMVGPFSNQPRD